MFTVFWAWIIKYHPGVVLPDSLQITFLTGFDCQNGRRAKSISIFLLLDHKFGPEEEKTGDRVKFLFLEQNDTILVPAFDLSGEFYSPNCRRVSDIQITEMADGN